jgi:hypothetical protein
MLMTSSHFGFHNKRNFNILGKVYFYIFHLPGQPVVYDIINEYHDNSPNNRTFYTICSKYSHRRQNPAPSSTACEFPQNTQHILDDLQ